MIPDRGDQLMFRSMCVIAWLGCLTVVMGQGNGATPVALNVTVIDKAGRPVRDLTETDFEVFDQGKKQNITSFSNAYTPASIVLLVDVSGSTALIRAQIESAADRFVRRVTPGDRVRTGTFAERLTLGPAFTSDNGALQREILLLPRPYNPSAIFDATIGAMDALRSESARRVVLLLTDGGDSSSRSKLTDVTTRAQTDNVAVYAVGFWYTIGRTQTRRAWQLKRLTQDTGGGYVESKTDADVNPAVDNIVDEIGATYSISFVPAKRDGKNHKLKVVVKRPEVTPHFEVQYR
jgi:Ca-activated chloride channel family protein